MTTLVQQLQQAQGELSVHRTVVQGEAAREFALANTALEDAIMRINRGFALEFGIFTVADVEAGGNPRQGPAVS